ncbi:hypothetical protein RRG08_042588 [Elysia crispata]|uniref:Uncharacterized protein n=1 Tax=Elysia crispata TaxID=231223 RepID=A0AAE0XQC0_9GAST|nr:hypothetical protein RRG08_042588 [Elysia crispata]
MAHDRLKTITGKVLGLDHDGDGREIELKNRGVGSLQIHPPLSPDLRYPPFVLSSHNRLSVSVSVVSCVDTLAFIAGSRPGPPPSRSLLCDNRAAKLSAGDTGIVISGLCYHCPRSRWTVTVEQVCEKPEEEDCVVTGLFGDHPTRGFCRQTAPCVYMRSYGYTQDGHTPVIRSPVAPNHRMRKKSQPRVIRAVGDDTFPARSQVYVTLDDDR